MRNGDPQGVEGMTLRPTKVVLKQWAKEATEAAAAAIGRVEKLEAGVKQVEARLGQYQDAVLRLAALARCDCEDDVGGPQPHNRWCAAQRAAEIVKELKS